MMERLPLELGDMARKIMARAAHMNTYLLQCQGAKVCYALAVHPFAILQTGTILLGGAFNLCVQVQD